VPRPVRQFAGREASVLVVGAGYQAVQWACELGNPGGCRGFSQARLIAGG